LAQIHALYTLILLKMRKIQEIESMMEELNSSSESFSQVKKLLKQKDDFILKLKNEKEGLKGGISINYSFE
jgi:hypothetical protein